MPMGTKAIAAALIMTAGFVLPGTAHADPAAAAGDPVAAPDLQRVLSPAAAQADVALLRRALKTIHPGLYRYSPRATIDAAFARLETVAAQPITLAALHAEIARLLAAIHCDHSKPEWPEAIEAYRASHPTHLPLRFRLVEGRMIVTATDGQAGAPPVGSEVVAINGMPVPQLLLMVAPLVAYDGDTDQAIAAKLSDDSDLGGDDLNEYYPALFGFADRWAIAWKPIGERRLREAVLAPITFADWARLDPPGAPYRAEFYNAITWRLGQKAALLRIDTFVNYRNPVQPTAFLAGFFRALHAAGTEHLILDLRNNGGGSEDVSVALGRYLLDAPFTWSKPLRYKAIRYGDLARHIDSWGDREALFNPPERDFVLTADGWYDRIPDATADERDDDISTIVHQPVAADRFAGRLSILTGPRNGSGATRTIAQLVERRGAVTIGEDSAGSAEGPTAGHVFLLTLPASGIKVRIPNAWNRTNIAHFTPRRGVAAQRLVVPTLADLQAGRDAALAIARSMPAPPADPAAALANALTGIWTGTLDYRDYGDDSRAVLPVSASVQGLRLAFSYDDGPGKTVTGRARWQLRHHDGADWLRTDADGPEARIVQFDVEPGSGDLTLVADGPIRENDAPRLARTILTRRGDTLRITKLTRAPGEPFLMRDSYELRR